LRLFDIEEADVAEPSGSVGLRENGVYLITGGAGGLGLIFFAKFLAEQFKSEINS